MARGISSASETLEMKSTYDSSNMRCDAQVDDASIGVSNSVVLRNPTG